MSNDLLNSPQIVAQYIILADETMYGFTSTSLWTPKLFPYQQTAFNVLYFAFVNPITMTVPPGYFLSVIMLWFDTNNVKNRQMSIKVAQK